MTGKGSLLLALSLVVAAMLAGCAGLQVQQPVGFAEFAAGDPYRAVSPEGVLLRVRSANNQPPQSQDFWVRALGLQLQREGYRSLGAPTPFTSPAGAGTIMEWLAPVGSQQYVFMTAVVVTAQRILIAEAAGPFALYQQHREGLVASLESLSWR